MLRSGPALIRCAGCGRHLAAVANGMVLSKHQGRRYGNPEWIGCERCATIWRQAEYAVDETLMPEAS